MGNETIALRRRSTSEIETCNLLLGRIPIVNKYPAERADDKDVQMVTFRCNKKKNHVEEGDPMHLYKHGNLGVGILKTKPKQGREAGHYASK